MEPLQVRCRVEPVGDSGCSTHAAEPECRAHSCHRPGREGSRGLCLCSGESPGAAVCMRTSARSGPLRGASCPPFPAFLLRGLPSQVFGVFRAPGVPVAAGAHVSGLARSRPGTHTCRPFPRPFPRDGRGAGREDS